MIGYLCAYLRYYYPIEFCTALLNNANNDEDLTNGTQLIHDLGFKLKSPLFRYSKALYFCDKENNTIYQGLGSIKYMSSDVAEELYSMRDMKFNNFIDLLFAMQSMTHKPDSRQLDILIKIGYFAEFGHAKALLTGVEVFNKFYKSKTIKLDKWAEMGYNLDMLKPYTEKMTEKTASGIDNRGVILSILRQSKMPKTTIVDMLKWKAEILGYVEGNDPNIDPNIWLVLDVKTNKYGTAWVKIYNLCYGCDRVYKVSRKYWNNHQFEIGDTILAMIEEKDKFTKKDDKFIKTGEKENIIKCWKMLDI